MTERLLGSGGAVKGRSNLSGLAPCLMGAAAL
jgi:hypothetical protein